MPRLILLCSILIFISFVQTLPFNTDSGEKEQDSGDSSISSEESVENVTKPVNGSGQDL